jgi:hypothetical protein
MRHSNETKWWYPESSCGGVHAKNSTMTLDSRRVSKIYGRRTRYSLKESNAVSAEQSLKDQHDFELALVQDFELVTQDVYEGAQLGRTFRLDCRVEACLFVAAQKVAT